MSVGKRNAGQIAKYIEQIWPQLEKRGGSLDLPPMNRKAKGEGTPAIGDKGLLVIDANGGKGESQREIHGESLEERAAMFALLRAELERLESGEQYGSYAGVEFSSILKRVRYDSGIIRRWRAGETKWDRERGEAFWKMCMGLGFVLQAAFPNVALAVHVSPEDEEARAKTREAQKIDTLYTRRLMVEQLEEVEKETGYKGKEAMEILSDRKAREGKDWSVSKLRRAKEVINRERSGEGDAA